MKIRAKIQKKLMLLSLEYYNNSNPSSPVIILYITLLNFVFNFFVPKLSSSRRTLSTSSSHFSYAS